MAVAKYYNIEDIDRDELMDFIEFHCEKRYGYYTEAIYELEADYMDLENELDTYEEGSVKRKELQKQLDELDAHMKKVQQNFYEYVEERYNDLMNKVKK